MMDRNFPINEFCCGPTPIIGPGQSSPLPTESTRMFRLLVKRPGARPMRLTLPAPTRGKAIMYCKNRWPDADVEVIE